MAGTDDTIAKRVLQAFYGRFRGRMRPLQEAVWDQFNTPSDLIVSAATGTGKTEAALAPAVRELLRLRRDGALRTRGLIIVPTRALATDLYRRLVGSVETSGLRLAVATSDAHHGDPSTADVLIRTPEGVDSQLGTNAAQFAHVAWVVLDEIHQFQGTARGSQLAGILWRISAGEHRPKRVAISATVGDPAILTALGLLETPLMIDDSTHSARESRSYWDWAPRSVDPGAAFVRRLGQLGVKKAIAFANTRPHVEEAAFAVAKGFLRSHVYAHHAGLSSPNRRDAEQRFHADRVGLLVATSTMEVGVDIGDVDTCVLFEAPKTRAAMTQRVGRAGRRGSERRVVCVAGLWSGRIDYARLLAGGSATPAAVVRHHLVGWLQQVLAVVHSSERTSHPYLLRFSREAFKVQDPVTDRLLGALSKDGWLGKVQADFCAGPALGALADRGLLHVTFAGVGGSKIVDASTGQVLGRAGVGRQPSILIGGKSHRIVGVKGGSGEVVVAPGGSGNAPASVTSAGPFDALAARYRSLVGGCLLA
jgi:hypothetical protein